MLKDCLRNIIGLTSSDCECLDFPDNWEECNETLTGQHVHGDMEFSLPLTIGKKPECGEGSIIDNLKKARDQAIESFITQYMIEMKKLKKKNFEDYTDTIGEFKNNSTMSYLTGDYVGLRISPDTFYKGASFCLRGGSIYLDAPDKDLELLVIDLTNCDENGDPIQVGSVEITSSKKISNGCYQYYFQSELELPLYANDRKVEYAIVYNRQDCNPCDIKFDCGCSNVNKIPTWKTRRYFKAVGIQSGSVENLPLCAQSDTTYGLCIDFTLKCDGISWICNVDDKFWTTSEWGRIATRVLVLLANLKLVGLACKPGSINFFSVVDPEKLVNHGKWLDARFKALMPYLAECTPADITHCYQCSPQKHGGYQKIDHLI